MAKKIRKKHVSIYCQYCGKSHSISEIDMEINNDDVKAWCIESGYELWLKKEEKQTLIDYMNN